MTLILELDPAEDTAGLEVFIEDVLVAHVNPRATAELADVMAGFEGAKDSFRPTYSYTPDSRDATLHVPEALAAACPSENSTVPPSSDVCRTEHIVVDAEAVANAADAYVIGLLLPVPSNSPYAPLRRHHTTPQALDGYGIPPS